MKKFLLALAAVTWYAGCVLPEEVCGCTPSRTHAILTGTVTATGGAPVADATITARIAPACDSATPWVWPESQTPVKTNAAGSYSLHGYSIYGPSEHCVTITAKTAVGDSAVARNVKVHTVGERIDPVRYVIDLVIDQR